MHVSVCCYYSFFFYYAVAFSDEIYLNGPAISMDNPKLIARIKERFLLPPSSRTEPYELKFPHLNDTSMGQAQKVFNILGNKVSQCHEL